MKGNQSKFLRERVAHEAAQLLYTSQEKEYKQAKQRASEILGIRILPTNFEVANQLDKIAEERDGPKRQNLILRMRKEAFQIMDSLKEINAILVGSVWRGTAHKNSDIDIHIFTQDPHQVIKKLQNNNYKIKCKETRSVTKGGFKESSLHLRLVLFSGDNVEIVVRNSNNFRKTQKCEIYGDIKKGLNLKQLTKILNENPFQKFIPRN